MRASFPSFVRRTLSGSLAATAALLLGACLVTDEDGDGSSAGSLDGAWLYVSENHVVVDPASGDTLDVGNAVIYDTNSVLGHRLAVIGGGTLTEIRPSSDHGTFNAFRAVNDSQWVIASWTRHDTLLVRRDGAALSWALRYQIDWDFEDTIRPATVWLRAELVVYDGPVPPALWSADPATVGNEPDNDSAQATAVVPGDSVRYGYLTAGDEDWYRIAVDSGAMLSFATQGPTDTYLSLYDAEGTVVAENDDAPWGLSLNAGIDHAFEAAGTYYVVVAGYNESETGYYSVTAMPVDSVRTGDEDEAPEDDVGLILGKPGADKKTRARFREPPLTRMLRP